MSTRSTSSRRRRATSNPTCPTPEQESLLAPASTPVALQALLSADAPRPTGASSSWIETGSHYRLRCRINSIAAEWAAASNIFIVPSLPITALGHPPSAQWSSLGCSRRGTWCAACPMAGERRRDA